MTKRYMTKVVGIDLDIGDGQTDDSFSTFVDSARARARTLGVITHDAATRRGWHLKVLLPRKVGFWQSINIRYFVGDDPRRMFYDIMRHHHGGRMIDTLFDHKAEGVPIGL